MAELDIGINCHDDALVINIFRTKLSSILHCNSAEKPTVDLKHIKVQHNLIHLTQFSIAKCFISAFDKIN